MLDCFAALAMTNLHVIARSGATKQSSFRQMTNHIRSAIARTMRIYPLLRPLAFALDAETAHRVTIGALKLLPPRRLPEFAASLAIDVAGLRFPSPVGLAAG